MATCQGEENVSEGQVRRNDDKFGKAPSSSNAIALAKLKLPLFPSLLLNMTCWKREIFDWQKVVFSRVGFSWNTNFGNFVLNCQFPYRSSSSNSTATGFVTGKMRIIKDFDWLIVVGVPWFLHGEIDIAPINFSQSRTCWLMLLTEKDYC